MKSVRVLIGAMALILLTVPAWAANSGSGGGGQPNGNNSTNGVPANLKAKIKADKNAVHADKQALDAAEQAAGLPQTFPPSNHGQKQGNQQPKQHQSATTSTPTTPAQHLSHMIQHVEKEIAKVQNLLGQANLPAAVTSAAQTLNNDLNTLKTDLTAAEAAVASRNTSAHK